MVPAGNCGVCRTDVILECVCAIGGGAGGTGGGGRCGGGGG